MKPTNHIIISFAAGTILMLWTKSIFGALSCLVSGVLIDLDHHLDYFFARKKFPFKYQDLLDYCRFDEKGRLYLIFHSYEMTALLWVAIFSFQLSHVWLGLAVGITIHLLCDQWSNPMRPFSYFLTYRMHHKFDKRSLVTEDYFNQKF